MSGLAVVDTETGEIISAEVEYHPISNCFRLLKGDELRELADDIAAKGLIDPIVLHEGKILDGRNRYRACLAAGVAPRFEDYTGDDPVGFAISRSKRRHDNESRRAWAAAKVANLARGGDRKSAEFQTANLRIDQSQAGELFNVSERLVNSAKKVQRLIDAGDADADLSDLVNDYGTAVSFVDALSGEPLPIQSSVVDKVRNGVRPATAIKQARQEFLPDVDPPEGEYEVIVIDPPWPMEKIARDVAPTQVGFDYPTMSEDELAAMQMPSAEDCHLWLWTTHRFLPMSLRLLDSWGFKYVCTFVWHKPGGFQPFGLPQYNCEFAVYARKGSPTFIDLKEFPVCFNAPRGAHSEKPEEFYDIVRRVTGGRRIDIFNRRRIDGFDVWGNESAMTEIASNG